MKSRYVSVRDIESRQLLARMGVDGARVEVVPDPVMGLPLREGAAAGAAAGGAAGAPVVGVSVRYWNKDRSDLDGIAAALRRVAEAQPHAVFRMLPFHMPDDLEASRHVAAQAGLAPERVVFAEQAEHPQEMLRQVSECSLLIGMRLHSLIYAASQMVPMIGVSYDPKIGQFLGRLGMEPAVTTAGLERDPAEGRRIADSALSLLDDADAWRRGHELAVAELKRQAQQPAQQIIQYLRNKG